MGAGWVISEAVAGDLPAIRELCRQYAAALPFDLSYQNFAAELAGLPAPYSAPEGCLLVARRAATAVGMVGLKRLCDGVGEIKRLYVVPAERGRGTGTALLSEVIAAARRIGYRCVRLDTHAPSMVEAVSLYRALGFSEIPPYGPDLAGQITFFEKALSA